MERCETPMFEGGVSQEIVFQEVISNSSSQDEPLGTYVKKGALTNTSTPTTIDFPVKEGRYAKLVALSEVNGNNWTSAAEIGFVGCKVTTAVNEYFYDASVRAFPIPTSNRITVNLPFQNGLNSYTYNVFSTSGQQITSGKAGENQNAITIDVQNYPSGYYFVILRDKTGLSIVTGKQIGRAHV